MDSGTTGSSTGSVDADIRDGASSEASADSDSFEAAALEAGLGDGTASDAIESEAGESFVCNQVTGLTLTRQWYEAGFERVVDDARWQLKAQEHAYVTEWANSNSPFWNTQIESPCESHQSSPDRVVFVVLSWAIGAQQEWEKQITSAVENFKSKYDNLRRIDLITIIRGPNNMLCPTPPAPGETIQVPAALDEAIAAVALRYPGFAYVGPKFAASSCADFAGGGPHLTPAGNAKLATIIGQYFTKRP